MTADLLAPVTLGSRRLRNRVVMAPVARGRADAADAADALHATYYAQRATAGMIVSEGTFICPQGRGYPRTPGLHTPAQIVGWRLVTSAVHDAGGVIFAQLWHVGRVSHPSLQPDGAPPVAPSAIAVEGLTPTDAGPRPFPTPRALGLPEIPHLVAEYAAAAQRARQAGFDGVEIHAANGYLIDQFLRDGSNRRGDAYGGTLARRARFLIEVIEAVLAVWPAAQVGVRLSPVSTAKAMHDSDPAATFGYVATESSRRGLAYLHVVEGTACIAESAAGFDFTALRRRFAGCYIANNLYNGARAAAALSAGTADLIAFGRAFVANPDLPDRLAHGAALNLADPATFEGGGAQGYTDYPRRDTPLRKRAPS